jgi:hypothetical protein
MNWQLSILLLAASLTALLIIFIAFRYYEARQRRIQLERKLALKRATRDEATFDSTNRAEIHEPHHR